MKKQIVKNIAEIAARWLYYMILLAVLALLFVSIYKERQTRPLDMEDLLEGRMPAQAESLTPYLEDIAFPLELKERDVFIGINTKPVLKDGFANWQITNPIGNQYVIDAEIVLQDGTRVFSSGSVPPGSSLEQGASEAEIAPGSYNATAYILSYSNLTYEYCGTFTVSIRLEVQ